MLKKCCVLINPSQTTFIFKVGLYKTSAGGRLDHGSWLDGIEAFNSTTIVYIVYNMVALIYELVPSCLTNQQFYKYMNKHYPWLCDAGLGSEGKLGWFLY